MNFQELAQKLKRIDEGVETQVQECGEMPGMMGAMPSMAPPQQDTVSMNVSMNAQGAGGIRDLMNVLKDIQDGPDHGPASALTAEPHGIEIDADPELDISMPGNDKADDMTVVDLGNDDKVEDEAYANEPDAKYQDQEYMNNTLAGGADEPQKMNKGGYNQSDNALTMAAVLPVAAMVGRMKEGLEESLKTQLLAHYTSIKEGAKEKEPEGLHSKKRFETDSQRVARIAREKRQAEKKERMKNDFDAEMERE